MRTERGLDRLVFFTDAVTAIAITLLILPLVDAVAGESAHAATVEVFFHEHLAQLGTFALSFVVIARLWMGHHALFEHVRAYSHPLLVLSLFWAFTIVLLPLPTAIIAAYPTDIVTTAFYIGTMTLSSLTLTAMSLLLRRNRELELESNPLSRTTLISTVITTVEFVIALVVGVVFPVINFAALLVFIVGIPIEAWITRRTGRSTDR